MKKNVIFYLKVLALLFITVAACSRQPQTENKLSENLVEVRSDMNLVLDKIDEAIASTEIPEFREKTVDAVSGLDKHIEDYIDGMYKNERKINEESRNVILGIKQKKVEVEFKLALIDKEIRGNNSGLGYSDTILTSVDASGTATGRPDLVVGGTAPGGDEAKVERPANDKTAVDVSVPDTALADNSILTESEQEPVSVEELHDEIVLDLQQLRKDITYFLQASLEED